MKEAALPLEDDYFGLGVPLIFVLCTFFVLCIIIYLYEVQISRSFICSNIINVTCISIEPYYQIRSASFKNFPSPLFST